MIKHIEFFRQRAAELRFLGRELQKSPTRSTASVMNWRPKLPILNRMITAAQ
jgi:hypothetical protein